MKYRNDLFVCLEEAGWAETDIDFLFYFIFYLLHSTQAFLKSKVLLDIEKLFCVVFFFYLGRLYFLAVMAQMSWDWSLSSQNFPSIDSDVN